MIQLIASGASPFVRKVRVCLLETGQSDVEIIEVVNSPTDTHERVAAANPAGKIPVLLRPEGPAIHDSRVICRYLNARAGATLYPEARIWEVLTLEASADAVMEAALACVYEARFRESQMQSQDWIEAQWSKVARSLEAIESRWMSHLNGPLDMGQIAVACALGYLDLRHDDRNWRAAHPALSAWEEGFANRPAMQDTRLQ